MTFNSYAMFCRRTEAPLKSRPYAAINQFIIIFLTPVLNSRGMKKLRYAIPKKCKNQAGMNLTPPPSSQNSYYYVNFFTPGSIDPRG